jgi:hypothetical protein
MEHHDADATSSVACRRLRSLPSSDVGPTPAQAEFEIRSSYFQGVVSVATIALHMRVGDMGQNGRLSAFLL